MVLIDPVNLTILSPSSITVTIQPNQVNADSKYVTVYVICITLMKKVKIKCMHIEKKQSSMLCKNLP